MIAATVGYLIIGGSSAVDVRFETTPTATEVSVNGEHCSAPCAIKLKAGKYAVEATHAQYATLTQEITVGSKPATIPLTLVAAGLAPATGRVPVGTLALAINVDGADIFVDGQLKDSAKGKRAKLTIAAGTHQKGVD